MKIPTSWWRLTEEEADRFNPPPTKFKNEKKEWYRLSLNDEQWLDMGIIHRPKTRWQWFWHDLYHGYAMHYPWYKVFWWSLIGHEKAIDWGIEEYLKENYDSGEI